MGCEERYSPTRHSLLLTLTRAHARLCRASGFHTHTLLTGTNFTCKHAGPSLPSWQGGGMPAASSLRSGGSSLWQWSHHSGRQCAQRQLRWGLSQSKGQQLGRCADAEQGKPGCLHSLWRFKVPPQTSSVTAEPCFVLSLNLAHGLGAEY